MCLSALDGAPRWRQVLWLTEPGRAVMKFPSRSWLWRLCPAYRGIHQGQTTCWHNFLLSPEFPPGEPGCTGLHCAAPSVLTVESGYGPGSSHRALLPRAQLPRRPRRQSSFSHASSTWKIELMIMLVFPFSSPVGICHAVFRKAWTLNSIVCGSIITPTAAFWRSMQIFAPHSLSVLIFDVCGAGHRQASEEALKEGTFSMSLWRSHA